MSQKGPRTWGISKILRPILSSHLKFAVSVRWGLPACGRQATAGPSGGGGGMTLCLSGAALWGSCRRSTTTETEREAVGLYLLYALFHLNNSETESSWESEELKTQWTLLKQTAKLPMRWQGKWWRDTRNYLWWIQALFLFVIAFQHNGCSINGKWQQCS